MDIEVKFYQKSKKAVKREQRSAKVQLIVDSVTLKLASKRNLYMCHIDYKKALGSAPYALFLEVFKTDKINHLNSFQKSLSRFG
jgi:hypothetical protein